MSVLGSAVDVGQLLQVVWTAAAAGLGLTVAFSLAVLGATRSYESQRASRRGRALAFALVATVALAACAYAVAAGIVVLAQK